MISHHSLQASRVLLLLFGVTSSSILPAGDLGPESRSGQPPDQARLGEAVPDLETGLTCVTEERRREGEEETLLSCGQSVLQVCHSTDLSPFSSSVGEECQEVYRRACRLVVTRRPTDQRVKTCSTPLSSRELQRSCITRYSAFSREEGSHEDSVGLRLALVRPSHSAEISQSGSPHLQTSCVIIRSVSGIN